LDTLRADKVRLPRLLQLSEEQARAAAIDQATLTGAPGSPVTMNSGSANKVRFHTELFRCRTDVYALRWGRRDGRSGWMPIGKGGDGRNCYEAQGGSLSIHRRTTTTENLLPR
jgi:hypothetical protein